MRKSLSLGAAAAVFAACFAGTMPAGADASTLPGGTSISVDITSPAPGAVLATGATTVTGTASVGAAPALKNSTIVYALDTSASTNDSSGVDCDGNGTADSVLACEKASVSHVNAAAAAATSPVANSGVARFNNTAAALDVDPAAGTQLLTAPGPNIDNAVAPLTAGGNTSFVAGLTAANTILTAPGAQATKTLVFLSDGIDTTGGTLPAVAAGTLVRTFAIGGANCGTGPLSLTAIAAEGAPGSSCTQITDLSVLDDLIGEQIGSHLDSLAVSIDGGPATPISNADIDPDLPQTGPATVSFSTSVTLASGAHQLCVTATGDDAGGVGSANDCVTVQVATAVVDCTVNCTATATDRNVSTGTLTARNLPKTVGLRANPGVPADCGGVQCVTGYDVVFQGTGTNGKASLLVHTVPKFSPPLLKAAVYVDGVKVTRSCISNLFERPEQLPCKIILPDLRGGIFYFVKFAADPGIRFR